MDGDGLMPTATGIGRFPSSQKLKDTCDMCSASKVRCYKEKPMCSRCDKLGYQCSYSPARRMGRPHSPRRTSSRKKLKAAVESPKGQLTSRPTEVEKPDSRASSNNEACVSREADIRQRTINQLQGSNNTFNNDDVVNFRGPATSRNGQVNCPQTDHYMSEESPRIRQKDPVEGTDARVNRTNSIEVDGLYCQGMSSDDSNMQLHNISSYVSSNSSTIGHLSRVPPHHEGSASNDSGYDCATVAMNMLQYLNTTSMNQPPSGANRVGEIQAPTPDALINTTSMAIKRVSTILVCPCSQKTDVGLLAAAVCAAILDIYSIIFHASTRCKIQNCSSNTTNKPTTDNTTAPSAISSALNAATSDTDRMEICPTDSPLLRQYDDAGNRPADKVTVIQVLEELSKVANLVMQFTKRYSDSSTSSSASQTPNQDAASAAVDRFLPALATMLKSRLRHLTNEATNWLAQV